MTVAVVDTGVDVEHRGLADRIKTYENFVDGQIYRAEKHGMAVAGVIGASLNDFGVGGVAPESNIAALRACHQLNGDKPAGECSTTSLVKAIDSAIRLGARVVNMSYGSAVVDGLIARLIEKGTEERVLFVAPVGNNRQQKSMMFPASHPAVVSVAGIGAEGAPLPNPDVASKARVRAPAENIFTTIPGNRHNFLGGTSLASAAVSGLLALAVERNGPMAGNTVPSYQGEFCSWEESLLKLTAICGRGN